MFGEYVATHLGDPSNNIDCQDINLDKMKESCNVITEFLLENGFAQEPINRKYFVLPLVKGNVLNLGIKEPSSQEENCRVFISVNYSNNNGNLLRYYTEQTEKEFLLILEKKIKEIIDLYFYRANI